MNRVVVIKRSDGRLDEFQIRRSIKVHCKQTVDAGELLRSKVQAQASAAMSH